MSGSRDPRELSGDETHDWHFWRGYECCKACGIIRRADRKNKPCKGPIHINLRAEDAWCGS